MRRPTLYAVVVTLAVLLAGCATTFDPTVGMTYQQFIDHHDRTIYREPVNFVGESGTWSAFETNGVYYYFENGLYRRSDQGEFYREQILGK